MDPHPVRLGVEAGQRGVGGGAWLGFGLGVGGGAWLERGRVEHPALGTLQQVPAAPVQLLLVWCGRRGERRLRRRVQGVGHRVCTRAMIGTRAIGLWRRGDADRDQAVLLPPGEPGRLVLAAR
eukprot:scaffold104323_cov45-Phaeocystis_antarctica.AAC.2